MQKSNSIHPNANSTYQDSPLLKQGRWTWAFHGMIKPTVTIKDEPLYLLFPPSVDTECSAKNQFSNVPSRQELSDACDIVKVILAGAGDSSHGPYSPGSHTNDNQHTSGRKMFVAVVRESPLESYQMHKFMRHLRPP